MIILLNCVGRVQQMVWGGQHVYTSTQYTVFLIFTYLNPISIPAYALRKCVKEYISLISDASFRWGEKIKTQRQIFFSTWTEVFLLHFSNINSLITDCTHSEEGYTSSMSVNKVAFWGGSLQTGRRLSPLKRRTSRMQALKAPSWCLGGSIQHTQWV